MTIKETCDTLAASNLNDMLRAKYPNPHHRKLIINENTPLKIGLTDYITVEGIELKSDALFQMEAFGGQTAQVNILRNIDFNSFKLIIDMILIGSDLSGTYEDVICAPNISDYANNIEVKVSGKDQEYTLKEGTSSDCFSVFFDSWI
ncbi:MAG: hypothetical protein SFT91_00880 [Rickettsiaceae bacterium]|nr:hypothetical protein [Rickettsiaceae bacterium]